MKKLIFIMLVLISSICMSQGWQGNGSSPTLEARDMIGSNIRDVIFMVTSATAVYKTDKHINPVNNTVVKEDLHYTNNWSDGVFYTGSSFNKLAMMRQYTVVKVGGIIQMYLYDRYDTVRIVVTTDLKEIYNWHNNRSKIKLSLLGNNSYKHQLKVLNEINHTYYYLDETILRDYHNKVNNQHYLIYHKEVQYEIDWDKFMFDLDIINDLKESSEAINYYISNIR